MTSNSEVEGGRAASDAFPPPHITARIRRLSRSLYVASVVLEVIAWLITVGAVIAGIAVAAHSSVDGNGDTIHPWTAAGLGIIGGGIMTGLFDWMLARTIRLYADHTAFQHDLDVNPPYVPRSPVPAVPAPKPEVSAPGQGQYVHQPLNTARRD